MFSLSNKSIKDISFNIVSSNYSILYISIFYYIICAIFIPDFASISVGKNIVFDIFPLLIIAIGQTFVLLIAGIDLSVTAIMAFVSVIGASIMTKDGGFLAGSEIEVVVAIFMILTLGAMLGAINGFCSIIFKMPAFIVTFTMQMLLYGLAVWYVTFRSTTSSIANLPSGFLAFAKGSFLGIPSEFILTSLVVFIAYFLTEKTNYGAYLRAVGFNPEASRVSGVAVRKIIISAYAICGLFSAISAILYTGRLETATPVLGENILLDIIGAAVIGGTSLFGGIGKIIWTIFGVLFLVLVDTSLKMLGLPLASVFAVKGSVILFAAALDAFKNR